MTGTPYHRLTPEQRAAKTERQRRYYANNAERLRAKKRVQPQAAPVQRVGTAVRERVEIAIARQWPVLRIMTELGVSYEQYRAVRDDMDTAETGERPCPHCDKSYVNLGRHVSAAHPETKAAVA